MPPTRIALIAPNPSDHTAWRLALRRVAADVCSVHLDEEKAIPPVCLWVVVLRGRAELLRTLTWTTCLTARTLLVIDSTPHALRLAQSIPHPVLITDRAMADALEEQIALLTTMTAGIARFSRTVALPDSSTLPLAA